MEKKFPDYGIHYIAINDGVNTANGIDDSLSIRDLCNEWHARDTSKKIKAVIHATAKLEQVMPISTWIDFMTGRAKRSAVFGSMRSISVQR